MGPSAAVAAVRRAVRGCLADLDPGDLVLLACSGGSDSTALAVATAFEAPRAGLRAGAVTVDHGLQPGSAERAAVVAGQLRALGLEPVEIATVDVATAGGVGTAGGPESAARTARYAALDAAASRLGAVAVLLGHTLDDQAETVLLGLARGSGARSLAGMAPRRGRYRRPLLDLRSALLTEVSAEHYTWTDPHNDDPAFARSRVRHDVLPQLEEALGPGVAAALARTAALLRDDCDALDGWAASEHRRLADDPTRPGDNPHELDVIALSALPAAIRTRVLRRAAIAAGAPPSDLTAEHVGELDRLLTDWHGQGPLHLPGRVRAARRCGTLSLTTAG